MDNCVWGIDGDIRGHAGAYINFSLGPYIGVPDEAEMQSIIVGLGELLATQGQYVRDCKVNAVRYIGDRVLDRVTEALRAVEPDIARERTEAVFTDITNYMRSAIKHAPTDLQL